MNNKGIFAAIQKFKNIYRLLHRKCDVRIFIHELQNFGKRTSERSERVSFPTFCNEGIKIRTKRVKRSLQISFIFLSVHHNGLYTQTAQD